MIRKIVDCILGVYMLFVCVTYCILILPLILLGYEGVDIKRNS